MIGEALVWLTAGGGHPRDRRLLTLVSGVLIMAGVAVAYFANRF